MNYLRGMDGELPGDAPEAGRANDGQRAPAASTAEAAYRVSEQQERAAGRGQIDYVHRFAASIEELGAGDRPIGAVGVIGSDIYDKLLVLQALRPRFPRAQFFTTDLDARFIHPSVFAYTRNLLVASHFGLELRRELQLGFLPFRDGYQTSTFLATRLAAGSGTEIDGLLESGQRPRLFEIARRRAVDITPEALGGASALNVHPPRMATVPGGGSLLMVGFIVLLATALVAPTSPALRRFLFTRGVVSEGDRWAVYAVSGLVLLLIVLMVSVGWTTDSTGGGEPFSILGGLSVWPTEMLRALATVLAVSFMFAGLAAIRRNDEQLGGACHLTLSTAKRSLVQPPPQAGRVGELVRWFTGATISEWGNMPEPLFGDGAREVKADRVWSRYLELGGTSHRFARCVPMAIVYLALSVAVVWFFDGSTMSWSRVSNAPVRGDAMRNLDILLFLLSFSGLTLLVFFVVDATRLCSRFIRILSTQKTAWPASLCGQVGHPRQLDLDDVSDYLDVRVIADRTRVITPLVVYPFVILFILLISRNSYFDHWDWPPGVILIFTDVGGAFQLQQVQHVLGALRHRVIPGDHRDPQDLDHVRPAQQHRQRRGVVVEDRRVGVEDDPVRGRHERRYSGSANATSSGTGEPPTVSAMYCRPSSR